MKHNRNRENIFMEKARKDVDPIIEEIHDALEDAYYNHWKLGKPKDFHGYNLLASLDENKKQFDALHGTLFMLHEIMIHESNMLLPEEDRTPVDIYNKYIKNGVEFIQSDDTKNRLNTKERKEHCNVLSKIILRSSKGHLIKGIV